MSRFGETERTTHMSLPDFDGDFQTRVSALEEGISRRGCSEEVPRRVDGPRYSAGVRVGPSDRARRARSRRFGGGAAQAGPAREGRRRQARGLTTDEREDLKRL